ncbi:MAG TPA: hypothetical protein VFZ56_14055 [Gemmatimonadaceae bacterium]
MRTVSDEAQYTQEEVEAIRRAFIAPESAGSARCPRCDVGMTSRPLGGGSFGLGYARRREWLICPQCKRSALFDLKRGTRN